MRTIRPKDEQDESAFALNPVHTASRSAKRRCISSACIPCRKRKSKCDGSTPYCSTCTAVYQTPCSYDVDSDHRRKAALKRDIETLKGKNDALGVIVASIRSSTDAEVAEIIQQIRADEDLDTLAENLKKNVMLPERSGAKTAEGELSNLIGRPSLDAAGVVKHYGHTSSLSLVSDGGKSPIHSHTSGPWTQVTQDLSLVDHLMTLYFTWSHPFYTIFSKELFLDDMRRGRNKYCSSLLVNALLAVGCAYSDRTETRSNPCDPSTAGNHFFAEARRLLYEDESSRLTTVQALALMGIRQASCGHDSSGFQYSGRCTRMLIELGLHVSFGSAGDKIGPTESEARKITFWGCFLLESAWAICAGRISQLPRAAVNIESPSIIEAYDLEPWKPYNDHGVEDVPGAEQPTLSQTLSYHFRMLTEIVSDTVSMFYAPRERFTSKKLLDFYSRYTRWYNRLPETLGVGDVPTPHVLVLHMYYHTVVLHLFRPFLKVDLANSKVSPREICTSCADNVASLLSTYRQIYGLRRATLLMSHIILSSSIINLLNVPNPSSTRNLVQGIASFREISAAHAFAMRALDTVMTLAKQWNISLPPEVFHVAYGTPKGSPPNMSHGTQNSPSLDSNFPPVLDHAPQKDHFTVGDGASETSFAVKNISRLYTNQADLFWSPFPDQSLPLQAHHHSGPMDISAMLDVPNEVDQLNRDGFKAASAHDSMPVPLAYSHVNGQWIQG